MQDLQTFIHTTKLSKKGVFGPITNVIGWKKTLSLLRLIFNAFLCFETQRNLWGGNLCSSIACFQFSENLAGIVFVDFSATFDCKNDLISEVFFSRRRRSFYDVILQS